MRADAKILSKASLFWKIDQIRPLSEPATYAMCIQNRSHVSFVLADPSWSRRAGKSESEKSKASEVGIDKQPWNLEPLQNYAKLVGSEFFGCQQ